MIKSVHIRNFRSIESQSIDLSSPIKILIGENGTGKTNALLALKFIASCLNEGPVRAIQNAGGLGQVFRLRERRTRECAFKVRIAVNNKTVHATRRYIFRPPNFEMESHQDLHELEYQFSLSYDSTKKHLVISDERLNCIDSNDKKTEIFSRRDLKEKQTPSGFEFEDRLVVGMWYFYFVRAGKIGGKLHEAAVAHVLAELTNFEGFNFNPEHLRKNSDLLDVTRLGYHGENFARVMFYLLNVKHLRSYFHATRSQFGFSPKEIGLVASDFRDSLEKILPFIKEIHAVEEIDSTQVNLTFEETHLAGAKYNPTHLSDGSLKFLACAAAICLRNYSFLFIEEIENYLNPKAIEFLFGLMKSYSHDYGTQYLITTHSETVLNFCEPEEILISKRLSNGSTHYVKPKNFRSLKDELDAGGFGLGTYWGKGGLED